VRNRLPVRERAAEPARIDEILRRTLGRVGDRVGCLPLGADEKNPASARDRVGHGLQGTMQHRHRLGEIDDVDLVTDAEDVRSHLRVPAMGLMAEVHASFQ
jgi:hypothetical protein